jgi:hypothetical protein
MNKQKMTDDEVVKGLECCMVPSKCLECPYFKVPDCVDALMSDEYELIKKLRKV